MARTTNKIKRYYTQAKKSPIKSLILLLGLFFLGRWLYNKFQGVDSDILRKPVSLDGLTYGSGWYIQKANELEELFGSGSGYTPEEAIGEVYRQLRTDKDVAELTKAYGIRDYYEWWNWPGFPERYSLSQALHSEMDNDEIEEYVNSELRNNGINFQY